MSRRKTILQVGENADDQALAASDDGISSPSTADETAQVSYEYWDESLAPARSTRDLLLTSLLFVAVLGWSGAFYWLQRADFTTAITGQIVIDLFVQWAIPALLMVVIWQLTMRNGTGEQTRFANAAALLSTESAQLETRLVAVNRELSLAREFIASQSRDLESFGRLAAEKLSASADHMQSLIGRNADEIDRIGEVSNNAISNMELLRDQLPVLANSARDMTNQIANTGNIAREQISQIEANLNQVDAIAFKGENTAANFNARLGETLGLFDRHASAAAGFAAERLAAIQTQGEEFGNSLRVQEDEATASFLRRAAELSSMLEQRNADLVKFEDMASTGMRERVQAMIADNDTLLRTMVERRNEVSQGAREMIEALEQRLSEAVQTVAKIDEVALDNARRRLAALAEESSRIEETLNQQASGFDADLQRRSEEWQGREMAALAALEQRLDQFDRQLSARDQNHLTHVASITERGEQLSTRLAQFDSDIARMGAQVETAEVDIAKSVDLLAERLSQSREILAANGTAIAELNSAGFTLLELLRTNSTLLDGELTPAIGAIETRLGAFGGTAESLHALLVEAEERGATLAGHVDKARDSGSGALELLQDLETRLSELAEKSAVATGQTRDDLESAISMLSSRTSTMLDELRTGHNDTIREIAGKIVATSHTAIAEALRDNAATTIAEIEASAIAASEAGRATVAQLRDQLAVVNQLTGNLEQRVSVAREKAEDQVGDDFARRMALITEALNSSAIDIAKAFDNDVADTQWANYLRGDRGIFTRRAVKLLDRAEARAVYDVYDVDSAFRETVNRYVHDFEAMLRSVLSTRDGNTMAVTLLSSDVGKLYVCLAQAIDRLRD